MTEKVNIEQAVSPQTDQTLNEAEPQATTPKEDANVTVPIKYNKEIKQLDLATAASLAQKGMKYDAIKDDYAFLKKLAEQENISVPALLQNLSAKRLEERKNELVEKCGGDKDLAEHILELENTPQKRGYGLEELTIMFPEIKTEDDVPHSVLEKAKNRGTLLLDEYLRYRLEKERNLKAMAENQKKAENSSLGSQQNFSGAVSPETEEFLKGLWK